MFALGTIALAVKVPVNVPPVKSKFKLDEPVTVPVTSPTTFPVTFPDRAPAKVVAVTVPSTCNFVDGEVVPIPIWLVLPSMYIEVTVEPPSLTLKIMSALLVKLLKFTPLPSTVIDKSWSAPTTIPPSFKTAKVPLVVSLAFDLR